MPLRYPLQTVALGSYWTSDLTKGNWISPIESNCDTNNSKQCHVDPYEGCVIDSIVKGSSDMLQESESASGLEHSAG
jgi:hypothetical protein